MNRRTLLRSRNASWTAIAIALGSLGTSAAAASADDAERARLKEERATIDAAYASRQAECQQRFVVASCIEDAKRDRRRALDALRLRQIAVDEAGRKERAEARRSELSRHAAEVSRREAARQIGPDAGASQPEARRDARRAAGLRHTEAAPARAPARRAPAGEAGGSETGAGTSARAAREGRSRATFEARQQRAAEHREEAEDRAVKRMMEHPPAKPLPLPPAKPAS
jgi:hypothetical protein